MHGEANEAVEARSLPIYITETESKDLPILSMEKPKYGEELRSELFIWMLEKVDVVDLKGDTKTKKSSFYNNNTVVSSLYVNHVNHVNFDKIKVQKQLAKKLKSKVSEQQIEVLNDLSARNIELAYLMFALSNTLGINIDHSIKKFFDLKNEVQSERTDVGCKAIIKETLKNIYNEHKDRKDRGGYQINTDLIKVSNKECFKKVNNALKEQEGTGISPASFKKYLREFGFSRPHSRKKIKVLTEGEEAPSSRLCNIFTSTCFEEACIKQQPLNAKKQPKEEEKTKLQLALSYYPTSKPKRYFLIEQEAKKKGINPLVFNHLHKALKKKGRIINVKDKKWILSQ